MDVVNNRRATFKNIKCNEWQLLEQYDFFLFGFYTTYIAAKFSILTMNMSL